MIDKKLDALRERLRQLESVVVCYSGGLDSGFTLAVAHEQLGHHAVGLTAAGPALAPRERDDAIAFASLAQVFVRRLAEAGAVGFILPDLPVEEAGELHVLAAAADLAPIVLMTPTSTDARLQTLGGAARGFVYVVARKGVTGSSTAMNEIIASNPMPDMNDAIKAVRPRPRMPCGK